MTKGFYDDNRTDGNYEAAVLTFCLKTKVLVQRQGLFQGDSAEELRDLVVRFECCERWIKDEQERVETKRRIAGDIESYVKNHAMNKHRLLAQRRIGYYIALFAAIRFHPAPRDWELILNLSTDKIPQGFAYYKLIEAIESLRTTTNANQAQLKQLHDCVDSLPGIRKYTDLALRIDDLIR